MSATVGLLDDLRAAIAAGTRELFDLNQVAHAAATVRGDQLQPYDVVAALGVLARAGEIEYTRHARRGGYRPATHIRLASCPCQPEITAGGIYQHHGPQPRNFAPVDGDDVQPDGTTTEIHQ